jgi:hypothetical protein
VSEIDIYKKRTFETLPQGCVTFFIQNRKGKERREKNCTRKKVRKKKNDKKAGEKRLAHENLKKLNRL